MNWIAHQQTASLARTPATHLQGIQTRPDIALSELDQSGERASIRLESLALADVLEPADEELSLWLAEPDQASERAKRS